MVNLPDFHQLLSQEVSRKEFLQAIGVALLSFIGITHLLRSVNVGLTHQQKTARRPSGYGSSAYGN